MEAKEYCGWEIYLISDTISPSLNYNKLETKRFEIAMSLICFISNMLYAYNVYEINICYSFQHAFLRNFRINTKMTNGNIGLWDQ